MTLVVDKRNDVAGPGFHVLIVGVSCYDHLPNYDEPPNDATWNLCSLGSPALSASAIAEWLMGTTGLAQPLKTLRLLMSPTAVEQVPFAVIQPTWDNFNRAVREWRGDCADDPASIAFFYYSGHGLARGRGEHNALLTMSDLFDPRYARLNRTAVTQNLVDGCAPQSDNDPIARNQVFFFDCCRTFPDYLQSFDDRNVPTILDVQFVEGVPDDRSMARFFAVPDNTAAFAAVGSPTYFGSALLDAFQNAGRNERPTGWRLDGMAISQRVNARYTTLTQRSPVALMDWNGPTLRNLPGPPTVDIEVQLEPTVNAAGRNVGLERPPDPLVVGVEKVRGHYLVQVEPGEYELKVSYPANKWFGTNDRQIILPDFVNPWISTNWP